jgi:hypothetical protein
VALEVQVLKYRFKNWCERWFLKLKNWIDTDYWLFKDTEMYCWPWPRSDKLDEIKFQIALNQVLASSRKLQKSIDEYEEYVNARNRL